MDDGQGPRLDEHRHLNLVCPAEAAGPSNAARMPCGVRCYRVPQERAARGWCLRRQRNCHRRELTPAAVLRAGGRRRNRSVVRFPVLFNLGKPRISCGSAAFSWAAFGI